MMTDHVLMVPCIGCGEHKTNVHAEAIYIPVEWKAEVARIVEHIDCKHPVG